MDGATETNGMRTLFFGARKPDQSKFSVRFGGTSLEWLDRKRHRTDPQSDGWFVFELWVMIAVVRCPRAKLPARILRRVLSPWFVARHVPRGFVVARQHGEIRRRKSWRLEDFRARHAE